jgi:hypothetical protein
MAPLLTPGCDSTPLEVSTPKGRTAAMAAATFRADRPPANISRVRGASVAASCQSARAGAARALAATAGKPADGGRRRHAAPAGAQGVRQTERCEIVDVGLQHQAGTR